MSDKQEKIWDMERQSLHSQIKMLTELMNKFQTDFVTIQSNNRNISPDRKQSDDKIKQKNKELLTTNQNLSQ
jgi:hypothetical protein